MLNKKEFAGLYAQVNGTSKKDAEERVEQFLAALTVAVRDHGGAKLNPLMTVEVVPTAERSGRNPSTGQEITIPAGHKVKVKQLKGLKELV